MTKVERLDILIPLHRDVGYYNLYFDGDKAISEEIYDPIELVADISSEYNNWNLNFDNAYIRIFTNINFVDSSYIKLHPEIVHGNMACIYEATFSDVLESHDFDLPVPQYCLRLFHLYINSCKYLNTIQHNNLFKNKNP